MISIEYRCPHCNNKKEGNFEDREIEIHLFTHCDSCGKPFEVSAIIEVSVRTEKV
jgi:NAD-dependent SIR2 family protein deacetylase